MTVFKWSQTADSNDDIDGTINFQEGQSPGSLNGSSRAMMAAIAKWRDDMSGNLVTGGTATAFTLTTNQEFTALTDGISVTCRMSATSGASPTLNVDGLGAKSIAYVYGTAVATGALPSGSIQRFTYDSTDDKWIAHNAREKIIPTGVYFPYGGSSAPAGWLISNGRTVGNASSNATLRANADTEDLFTFLWTNYANAEAAIYDSAGSASSRGASAAADYAANKAIATINTAGRVFRGLDNLGIGAQSVINTFVTSEANGKLHGAQGVALTEANLASHQHGAGSLAASADGGHSHTVSGGTVGGTTTNSFTGGAANSTPTGASAIVVSGGSHTHDVAGDTATTGSGTQHSNIDPGFLGYWIIKL